MSTSLVTKKRLVSSAGRAADESEPTEPTEPTDVTPAEPADAAGGPPADPPPAARGFRPTPAAAAAVVLVLLLVGAVAYLWVQLDDSRSDVDRLESAAVTRAQVLEQARDLAVALTTYDYRDLPAQQRLLEKGSTDAFQQKFADTNKTLAPMFTQLEASAKGTVVDLAVQKVDGDLATVLVFADQSASSKQSAEPTSQASRLRLHLVRHGDTWLLDSVDLL